MESPLLSTAQNIPLYAWFLAIIVTNIVGGLAALPALLTVVMNRRKPDADIRESRARAAKSFAEADEITVRASLTLGEEAIHWTRAMMRAQQMIFSLQEDNDHLKAENRRLQEREPKQIRK